MATTAELLAATDEAILNCLTAQSYSARGRAKQSARLKELQDFRRELLTQAAEESSNSGSMCSVGEIFRPR